MGRTVYLARHGETTWNQAGRWQGHTDVALHDPGREQARRLAEAMRGRGITEVWASDLARARETAEIAAEVLGLPPVVTDPGLRERGFGCFEGLTREECALQFPDEWARYRADVRLPPPGGEPQSAVVERMREAVLRASRAVPEGAAVLVVSHGGAIRALINAITGVVPPPLENGAVFAIAAGEELGPVERIV
jgi:broad specificity phosphatase PhoE